jgi:hypothetical protein
MTKSTPTVAARGKSGQPAPEPTVTLAGADMVAALAAWPSDTALSGPLADLLADLRQRADADEAPIRQQRAALEAERVALVQQVKDDILAADDRREARLVLLKTSARLDPAVLDAYRADAVFVSAAATAAYDVTHDPGFRRFTGYWSALDRLPQSLAAVALMGGPVTINPSRYPAIVEKIRALNDRLLALSVAGMGEG